jgi:hypothetical protein
MPNAIDPERLAALLDGRLGGEAREALIAELAESDDETLHAYADAAAVAAELAADAPVDLDTERRARTGRRPWRALAFALAAAVVLMIGVPFARQHSGDAATDATFVRGLAQPPNGVPALPWGVTRGAGDALPTSSRAVRVGALMTDLEFANRSNPPAAAALADVLGNQLAAVTGGAAAGALYQGIASVERTGKAASDQQLSAARSAAAGVLDPTLVPLGAWLQAGRVAAAQSQSAFFTSDESAAMLGQLGRMYGAGPAHATLDRLQSELRAPAPDWAACQRLLTTLLEASGR